MINQCPIWELSRTPPEYEPTALPLRQFSDAVQSDRSVLHFRGTYWLSTVGSEQAEQETAASRRYIPLKQRWTTRLHEIAFHKTVLVIVTAMRAVNLREWYICLLNYTVHHQNSNFLNLSFNLILNSLQVQPSGIRAVGLVHQKLAVWWMAHWKMATAQMGNLARRVVVILTIWAALLVKCRQAAVILAQVSFHMLNYTEWCYRLFPFLLWLQK
jgi:hypothetical protein